MAGRRQLVAHRFEVVYFAVKDNPDLSVRAAHRLLAASNVDNGQTPVAHNGAVQHFLPMLVRSAVADGGIHEVQPSLIRQATAGFGIGEDKTAHGTDLAYQKDAG